MTTLLSTTLLMLLGFAPATQPTGELPADAGVEEILDALEARGDNLTSLSADLMLEEEAIDTGAFFVREGNIWLADPRQDPKLRVRFDTREQDGRQRESRLDYVLRDNVLDERDWNAKSASERRLAPQGEQLDLFKLGEGPFPLPIGQNKKDVQEAFEIELLDAADGPDGTVGLRLTPREGSPLENDVLEIDLWVGRADALPRKVVTVDVNETVERVTRLKNVEVNPTIEPTVFELGEVPEGWRRSVE